MLSENIKQGVERAPNRSLLYALGLTDEEIRKPLIGVVSSYNEIVPGHMNLDKIAEAVKAVDQEKEARRFSSPRLPSATGSPWGTSA